MLPPLLSELLLLQLSRLLLPPLSILMLHQLSGPLPLPWLVLFLPIMLPATTALTTTLLCPTVSMDQNISLRMVLSNMLLSVKLTLRLIQLCSTMPLLPTHQPMLLPL